MFNRDRIREGQVVRSTDGEKLGKVRELATDHFIIEKGLFFKKEYVASYDLVTGVQDDGDLILSLHSSELREPADTMATDRGTMRSASDAESVTVPVASEELVAEKRSRQAGEVRVRKDVVTEQKNITVPVTREEVRVERVPASGTTPADTAFKEGTVTIPLREEEVEFTKRPVVREEVRVSKQTVQDQRSASENVRREEVTVDTEGTARSATGRRIDLDDDDLNRRKT
jgi:uncharacterized protein (TIGR02271 family)